MKYAISFFIAGIATIMFSGCTGNVKESSEVQKVYPAIETGNMDTSINPGDDFFMYVNGNWVKNNPIPSDKNSWSAFAEISERNRTDIKSIIENAASQKDAAEGSISMQIGSFYNAGMDTSKIEMSGIEPLNELFAKIESIKSVDDVQSVAAYLQKFGIGPFFYIFPNSDQKNSEMVIANLFQSGLGLPDRDYYFRTDPASRNILQAYNDHLKKMFILLKYSEESAAKNAQTIMNIETRLAKVSFTNVENQDPQKTYNKVTIDDLAKLAPGFDWKAYMVNIGYPQITEVNAYQPAFLKELGRMMQTVPVEDWKTFLKWNLINQAAAYLSSDFEKQNFDFYHRTLSGQEKPESRWKRVLDVTSGSLGEAIGQLYVKEYFPPEAKQKMIVLVGNLKQSLKQRIENLSWIGSETKKEALAKLEKMNVKVGYPDKWRDYSGLKVTDSYVTNILNSGKFEFEYSMNKVGKPVDRTEWGMTPQTVNAYYNPSLNEIVFPAAILQPPFFNINADDAVNYGGIGLVIGHEMTHGFDNMGRQFDKDGNLHDWWTPEDVKSFNEHTQVLVDEYNKFEVLDSLYINGKLTLGENIADLGGATVAFNAYRLSLAGKPEPELIDGFTGNQRFFLSFGQIWRNTMREQELRKRVLTDEHSPARFRVNGTVFNMPEFYAAFPQVKPGDRYYRDENMRPVIW
ncbi:MAG TPA: M13 family metallopeptidase [Bacteroidales bacterium]|nr:M13 family metallopeptidase [Bacteroidales bacterium]